MAKFHIMREHSTINVEAHKKEIERLEGRVQELKKTLPIVTKICRGSPWFFSDTFVPVIVIQGLFWIFKYIRFKGVFHILRWVFLILFAIVAGALLAFVNLFVSLVAAIIVIIKAWLASIPFLEALKATLTGDVLWVIWKINSISDFL